MRKINKQKFKAALVGSYGVQSVIAQKLDVTRQAVNQFINKYPDMKDLCFTEREKIIDVSENRLFKSANDGEKWAVDKILSTIGKSRGYIEKQEQSIEHKGEGFKLVIESPTETINTRNPGKMSIKGGIEPDSCRSTSNLNKESQDGK